MKVISVENVSKKFVLAHDGPRDLAEAARGLFRRAKREDFWALKDVRFEVEQGDALGIVGRNGAGKSTVLKLITGIMDPTKGRVRSRGRICSLIEVGAGFHPEMTGRENIYLNGSILGMSRREIDSKLDEIVSFAELERFIDTPVKRYSSGMYARLGFSVAAHVDPDILIVDEVLSVGDVAFQKKCLGRMEEASQSEGRTVVYVSHNLSSVQSLCSKAILLRCGELIREGSPDEVVKEYLGYLEQGAESAFEDNPDRSGSGFVRLTGARVTDINGNTVSGITAGDSANLEFSYENHSDVSRADLIFTVYNEFGVPSTHFNMTHTDFSIDELGSKGVFICHVRNVPFPIGRYRIAACLRIGGETADLVPNALVFDVNVSRFYSTGLTPSGQFCGCMTDHNWEHHIIA